MKTKLKVIVITFAATTVFWCLFIVGFFWLLPQNTSVSFIQDAQQRGFVGMVSARNVESGPVTFIVEELRTNTTSANNPQVVLLRRQLPPSGEFWVGIRKTKTETK